MSTPCVQGHAEWQGKVFWRNYPEGNYENFYQATGYGTATGLGGYNCRHQFYAFFGEDDEETYEHIDETVNKQAYEMEQKQRSLERKIREWDRKKKILEAGGQDTTEAKKVETLLPRTNQEPSRQLRGFLKEKLLCGEGVQHYTDLTEGERSSPTQERCESGHHGTSDRQSER